MKLIRSKGPALAALALATAVAGCASSEGVPVAVGQFEENSTLQTLTGVGLIPQQREEIAYRPRSPLVLPKGYQQLPEPEPTQVAAVTNPAWPNDPDVERRRREKEFEALPLNDYRRQRGVPQDARDNLLSPEEMAQGTNPNARQQGYVIDKRDDDVWLLPSEYQRKPSAEELEEKRLAATTVEPRRRYLTEPPTGYRAPVAAKTPEGQKAAEEAIEARRENAGPERRGFLSWLGL